MADNNLKRLFRNKTYPLLFFCFLTLFLPFNGCTSRSSGPKKIQPPSNGFNVILPPNQSFMGGSLWVKPEKGIWAITEGENSRIKDVSILYGDGKFLQGIKIYNNDNTIVEKIIISPEEGFSLGIDFFDGTSTQGTVKSIYMEPGNKGNSSNDDSTLENQKAKIESGLVIFPDGAISFMNMEMELLTANSTKGGKVYRGFLPGGNNYTQGRKVQPESESSSISGHYYGLDVIGGYTLVGDPSMMLLSRGETFIVPIAKPL